MRILVPVKRVMDPYAKARPTADGAGIDAANAKFEINPFDEIAIEEAVRIKEKDASAEIMAVSIGPPECEDQLRKALAMGADHATLIETSAFFDPPSVAAELAALAAEIKPDLVLMGKQATDDDSNQVGQMLAARLGWPQATFVSKIELAGATIRATRETDDGEETIEASLPCVATADLRLNQPRYIALPGIIKARSKPLERRAPLTIPKLRTRLIRAESPPPRAPGRKVGSVDDLISVLRERGVVP